MAKSSPPLPLTAIASHPKNCTCCLLEPRPSFSPKKNKKKKKQEETEYLQTSCLLESSTSKCTVSILFRVSVLWWWSFSQGWAVSLRQWRRPFIRKETKAKRTSLETILTLTGVPVDWSWGSIHSPSLPHLPPVYVQKDIYIYRYMDLIAQYVNLSSRWTFLVRKLTAPVNVLRWWRKKSSTF